MVQQVPDHHCVVLEVPQRRRRVLPVYHRQQDHRHEPGEEVTVVHDEEDAEHSTVDSAWVHVAVASRSHSDQLEVNRVVVS